MRTAALLAISLLMIGFARAGDPPDMTRKPIQIPAQELGVALQSMAEMEGWHVVFLAEDVAHRNTQGATGNLTFNEALEQLLRNTELTYRFLDPHTAMILPGSPVQGASLEQRSITGPENNIGDGAVAPVRSRSGMNQVTVIAKNENGGTPGDQSPESKESRRAELFPKVSKFLTEVAALEPPLLSPKLDFPTSGVLPAWSIGICPQVTGLPRQEGVLLLTRVLETAHAVNAGIADQHCKPNFHIYVTDQPKALLEQIEKHNAFNSFDVFGHRGRRYLLDQFIATPRPVKVWYNIAGFNIVRVIVIVDETRVGDVPRDQLADYIAMVGLAEIKPDAQPGNAPTILRLFTGPLAAAPQGLTDWDVAFLRSLNSFEGPWRRGIARPDRLALSMLNKIVP